MSKNWKKVRDAILSECDRIWFDEPKEVTMVRMGIYPGKAGVDDFVFGAQYILTCETQVAGWGTVEPTMYQAIADPEFSLDACKNLWIFMNWKLGVLVGGIHEPQCPAPWLNQGKWKGFYEDIVDSFDSITTKDQLRDMVWVFNGCYVTRLHYYLQHTFPWEHGQKRVDIDYLKKAAIFLNAEVVEK